MRVIVFIGYLCFLLLGGGPTYYAVSQNKAASSNTVHQFFLKNSFSCSNKDESNLLIEDTDFDVEEEHLSSKDIPDDTGKKPLSKHKIGPFNGYFSFTQLSCEYQCKNLPIKARPSLGKSAPIYIKNRVLRI